jgi:uncharacterized membrane protein YsdA (DUF1294 family)
MFASLGVELGIATRLVIGAYRLAFPILFGGAAGVVLTKQWFVRDKWANVSFSLGVAFVVDFVGGLIVQSLYAPLLDLVEKLNK